MRWKLIPRNVADLVSLPREVRYTPHTLTKEEAVQLMRAARDHPLESLVVLALTTGMRHGEIAALRWRAMNLEARTVRVERTVTFISGHGYIEGSQRRRRVSAPSSCRDWWSARWSGVGFVKQSFVKGPVISLSMGLSNGARGG